LDEAVPICSNFIEIVKIYCCKLPNFELTDGLHPNVSHLSKNSHFHPNLNEAFIICSDLIEAVGPYPNAMNLLKGFIVYPKLD